MRLSPSAFSLRRGVQRPRYRSVAPKRSIDNPAFLPCSRREPSPACSLIGGLHQQGTTLLLLPSLPFLPPWSFSQALASMNAIMRVACSKCQAVKGEPLTLLRYVEAPGP